MSISRGTCSEVGRSGKRTGSAADLALAFGRLHSASLRTLSSQSSTAGARRPRSAVDRGAAPRGLGSVSAIYRNFRRARVRSSLDDVRGRRRTGTRVDQPADEGGAFRRSRPRKPGFRRRATSARTWRSPDFRRHRWRVSRARGGAEDAPRPSTGPCAAFIQRSKGRRDIAAGDRRRAADRHPPPPPHEPSAGRGWRCGRPDR